jgi:serine/threonine protein phosphatase PrpC
MNDNYHNKNQNNMTIENEIVKNDYYIKLNYINIEFSFMENQNIQFENTMEDKSKSLINFNNNPNEILLEIFDGHGGVDVSTYLQKNFSKVYKRYLNETQNNIAKSFSMAFNQVDEDIRQTQVENQGSTGTIIHIIRENNNRLFVFNGNVGDSRVSLISSKKIIRLSQDHRTTDNEERKRVISEGGMVFNNRVNGELMLTRSFGDFDFKSSGKHKTKKIKDELSKFRRGVICEPFVTQIEIDQSIKNQFLFLASDGVWDVVSEEEMQQLIKVNNDTKYLSSIIIEKALFKQAWDNLSVFVVKLT